MDAIVAVYGDWGIGKDGTQPITVKADRKHFAEVTSGSAVIVGRKTLADFPGGKPLKNRNNYVLTRQDIQIEGAQVVHSVEEALQAVEKEERVFVIGGAQVYRDLFPYMHRVYVTKIDCTPESDSYFPNLDSDSNWEITDLGEAQAQEDLSYRFITYERKNQ